MKIAILFHKNSRRKFRKKFDIGLLADIWECQGHEVIVMFGIENFVPADVCIVHVDLTEVPGEYLDFAGRYPVVINGVIKDIQKRNYSEHQISPGDNYIGRVIVKSNQNSAGWPEFIVDHNIFLQVIARLAAKLNLVRSRYYSSSDYQVYDNLDQVPAACFDNPYFLVEKFLPELVDSVYYVNMYIFFGDCHECYRLGSLKPVVKAKSIISRETIDPHPEILKIREKFNIDYGKLDYCIHDGEVVLLDVNKVIGFGGIIDGKVPPFDNRANALLDLVALRS